MQTTTSEKKKWERLADDEFQEDLFDPDTTRCEGDERRNEHGTPAGEAGIPPCSPVVMPICYGCLVTVDKCICHKKAEDFLHRDKP